MIECPNLQVFSSDQAPSIMVKNAVKKACSRHQHVVSCVENLTADVKPCTGEYHNKPSPNPLSNKPPSFESRLSNPTPIMSNNILISTI